MEQSYCLKTFLRSCECSWTTFAGTVVKSTPGLSMVQTADLATLIHVATSHLNYCNVPCMRLLWGQPQNCNCSRMWWPNYCQGLPTRNTSCLFLNSYIGCQFVFEFNSSWIESTYLKDWGCLSWHILGHRYTIRFTNVHLELIHSVLQGGGVAFPTLL